MTAKHHPSAGPTEVPAVERRGRAMGRAMGRARVSRVSWGLGCVTGEITTDYVHPLKEQHGGGFQTAHTKTIPWLSHLNRI